MKYFSLLFSFLVFSLLILPQARAAKTTYEYAGKTFEGYFIKKSAKAPLIILIHDWDGLGDYEIKRSEMLAKLGYSVFAVDLFGQGIRPQADNEKKELTGALYKDREKMRGLLNAALATAEKNGLNTKNVVVAGYCFGGAAALEFARSGAALRGFVAFHGGLETPAGQNYNNTKGKILVLHGSADTSVSMEQFAQLNKELEAAKIENEMIAYSGAPHAFTVFGSDRYRQDADEKSWNRFQGFLKEATKN